MRWNSLDKGTRVKLKVQEPYAQEYLADGQEGAVTSSHTNGMIYVQMDAMPSVGSWAFSESELERIAA